MRARFERFCPKCGRGFVDVIALSRHMLRYHS